MSYRPIPRRWSRLQRCSIMSLRVQMMRCNMQFLLLWSGLRLSWKMRDEFQTRRDLICSRLNEMEGVSCHVPDGAFYVFPKIDVKGMTSEELAMEIAF